MVDFLVHYYARGGTPFRTLSDLPDEEAIPLMRRFYRKGSVFWERFEDPERYLSTRRSIERWLHDEFVAKGGKPSARHPIYMVLGRSPWTQRAANPITIETTAEIEVPLALFDERDVSFTYPDSMVSPLVAAERDPKSFQAGYHGVLFTLSEIREVIERKGMPGEGWETNVPDTLAHYIEVQVWNRDRVIAWYEAREGLRRSDTRAR